MCLLHTLNPINRDLENYIRSRCKLIDEYEKPSKYFLNLEKAVQKVKHIRCLVVGEKRISNPAEILNTQALFYTKLYSANDNISLESLDYDKYLNNINPPVISNDHRDQCDQMIQTEEISKAVQDLPNNKSPGPDGIPIEFYKKFWCSISDILFDSFKNSFETGQLSPSQKRGVITLVPKKDKDLTDLKSWRPLSLLNTDYKILAKLLANRLRPVLSDIINPDQIGYMKNRFCGENTRLIADVIDFCNLTSKPGIVLLADFEKAFDTINWHFLDKALQLFGFGKVFCKWIDILYKDIESCVTNNGYQSTFFKLFRGIRQGCPISALLFLIPAELIASIIRNSSDVHGFLVNGKCIKLCQLADDMTLFLTDTISVKNSLQLFEEFYRNAGLKLNKNKTEVIIIYNDGSLTRDESLGIKWVNKPIKTLGAWFSLNQEEMIKLNVNDKVEKIKVILNSWSKRNLTLKGKVTVVKSLVLPHFLHLASVATLSRNLLSNLDKLIFDFVWNKKQHLVSKNTLIKPVELGGMKMISIFDFAKTVQIMFIKRLLNQIDANWKCLSEYLMGS